MSDIVVRNARIWSPGGVPAGADTAIVRDGVFVFVGHAHDANPPTSTRTIDGASRRMLPGFTDAHAHLLGTGAAMNAWDVWECDLGDGKHPVVVISHPGRAAHKDVVEILDCSSQRPVRPPLPNEVILDSEDGMNWQTFCKCDLIYSVHRSDINNRRGHVSIERRRLIVQAIIRSHAWTQF